MQSSRHDFAKLPLQLCSDEGGEDKFSTLPWQPMIGIALNAITALTPLPGSATEYAFGRMGDTSIRSNTIPITEVPPNTFKADQQIMAG